MRYFATVAIAAALASPVAAEGDSTVYSFDGSFEDATFGVESAIVGRGLVVDYVSYVGDMLNRTGADVGSDVKIFDNANIYIFCSAVVSRSVMETDPMNLAFCPYGIFVAEREGAVMVGYRNFPDGPMQEVQMLLDGIAREVVGE